MQRVPSFRHCSPSYLAPYDKVYPLICTEILRNEEGFLALLAGYLCRLEASQIKGKSEECPPRHKHSPQTRVRTNLHICKGERENIVEKMRTFLPSFSFCLLLNSIPLLLLPSLFLLVFNPIIPSRTRFKPYRSYPSTGRPPKDSRILVSSHGIQSTLRAKLYDKG